MNRTPTDANGYPFRKATFWLPPQEYGKIVHEINQLYDSQYKGKPIASHPSFGIDGIAYIYWFENHGFNNYNFFMKTLNKH